MAAALALAILATALSSGAPHSTRASLPVPGFCPADADQDGIVGGHDAAQIADAWLSLPGDERWDAALDLNGDLVIGAGDVAVIVALWLRQGCDPSELVAPTLWTGTAEYHEHFCPGGEIVFEALDPQEPEGASLYRIPLAPEECLRASVPGSAVYSCEVGGAVVSSIFVEPISNEHTTQDGHHVCNPQPAAD